MRCKILLLLISFAACLLPSPAPVRAISDGPCVNVSFKLPDDRTDIQYALIKETYSTHRTFIGRFNEDWLCIPNLPKGTNLRFTVQLVSTDFEAGKIGTSMWMKRFSPPGPVSFFEYYYVGQNLTLAWGEPSDFGGSIITGYVVECSPDCGAWDVVTNVLELESFQLGQRYSVFAFNTVGNGTSTFATIQNRTLSNMTISEATTLHSSMLCSELIVESDASLAFDSYFPVNISCDTVRIYGSLGSSGEITIVSKAIILAPTGSITVGKLLLAATDTLVLEGSIAQSAACPSSEYGVLMTSLSDILFSCSFLSPTCSVGIRTPKVANMSVLSTRSKPWPSLDVSAFDVHISDKNVYVQQQCRFDAVNSLAVKDATVFCADSVRVVARSVNLTAGALQTSGNSDSCRPKTCSHGGLGSYFLWGDSPPPTIGNLTEPTLRGAIRIFAQTISGDASSSISANGAGLVAGGSVWITCSKLAGAFLISASGTGSNNGRYGSGGRISVNADSAMDYSGKVAADSLGTKRAQAGTVWWNVSSSWESNVFAVKSDIVGLVPTPQQLQVSKWIIDAHLLMSPAFDTVIAAKEMFIGPDGLLTCRNLTLEVDILTLFGDISAAGMETLFTLGSPRLAAGGAPNNFGNCIASHAGSRFVEGCLSAEPYGDMRSPTLPGSISVGGSAGGVIRIKAGLLNSTKGSKIDVSAPTRASAGSLWMTIDEFVGTEFHSPVEMFGRVRFDVNYISPLLRIAFYNYFGTAVTYAVPLFAGRSLLPFVPQFMSLSSLRQEEVCATAANTVEVPTSSLVQVGRFSTRGSQAVLVYGKVVMRDLPVLIYNAKTSVVTVFPNGTFVSLRICNASLFTSGSTLGGEVITGVASPNITHCRFETAVVSSELTGLVDADGFWGFQCTAPSFSGVANRPVEVQFAAHPGVFVTPYDGAVLHYYRSAVLCDLLDSDLISPVGCNVSVLGNGTCHPACNVLQCGFSGRDCRSPPLFVAASGNDSSTSAELIAFPFRTLNRAIAVACRGFSRCLPLLVHEAAPLGFKVVAKFADIGCASGNCVLSQGNVSAHASLIKWSDVTLSGVARMDVSAASLMVFSNVTILGPTVIDVNNSALRFENCTLDRVTIVNGFDGDEFGVLESEARRWLDSQCPACSNWHSRLNRPALTIANSTLRNCSVEDASFRDAARLSNSQLNRCDLTSCFAVVDGTTFTSSQFYDDFALESGISASVLDSVTVHFDLTSSLALSACVWQPSSTFASQFGLLEIHRLSGGTLEALGGGVHAVCVHCAFSNGVQPVTVGNDAAVTFNQSSLSSNAGNDGSALRVHSGGIFRLWNSTVQSNTAYNTGGVGFLGQGARVECRNTVFRNNIAVNGGGVFRATGNSSVVLIDSTFQDNKALQAGVLWLQSGSTAQLTNCALRNNIADVQSGGVVLAEDGASVELDFCESVGSAAATAGGFAAVRDRSFLTAFSCVFQDAVGALGGALYVLQNSFATARNSSFLRSFGHQGGAAYASFSSSVELVGSSIQGSSAYQGGALYACENSTITLRNSPVVSTTASGSGSVAYADRRAKMEFHGTLVSGNAAQMEGTVVADNADLLLNSTTLANNSAAVHGGIIVRSGGELSLFSSTISNNSNPSSTASGLLCSACRVRSDRSSVIAHNLPFNVLCDSTASVHGGAAPLDGYSCQHTGSPPCIHRQSFGNATLYFTGGGGVVELSGEGLLNSNGTAVGVQVFVSGLLSPKSSVVSADSVSVVLPPWFGVAAPIVAYMDGQGALKTCEAASMVVSEVTYATPVVDSVLPAYLPTVGGLVDILGKNFGTRQGFEQGSLRVWFEGVSVEQKAVMMDCGTTLQWVDQFHLQCNISASYAPYLTVFVMVSGQKGGFPTHQVTVPSPPDDVSLHVVPTANCKVHPTSLLVRWYPTFDGGFEETLYHLRLAGSPLSASPGGEVTFYETVVSAGNGSEYLWTGLDPGWRYTAAVQAENPVGVGTFSEWGPVKNLSLVSKEGELLAEPPCSTSLSLFEVLSLASRTVVARWLWPTQRNGTTITEFVLQVRDRDNEIAFLDTILAAGSRQQEGDVVFSQVEIGPLALRHVYFASVATRDAGGLSGFSAELMCTGLTLAPEPPDSVVVPVMFPNLEKLTVSWSPSPDSGGLTVGRYFVYFGRNGRNLEDFFSSKFCNSSFCREVQGTTVTLMEIAPGVHYVFAVAAQSCLGDFSLQCLHGKLGKLSNITEELLFANPPGQPAAPFLEMDGHHVVKASWREPALNGAPITAYKAECRVYCLHESSKLPPWSTAYEGSDKKCTVDDVPAGCTTECIVSAVNAAGWSVQSSIARKLAPCPPGSFVTVTDTDDDICLPCDAGFQQPAWGQNQCVVCPEGWFTLNRGAPNCSTVPATGVKSVNGLPQLLPGHWYSSTRQPVITASMDVYRCPRQQSCLVGGPGNQTATCAAGYEGVLCALCQEGFGKQGDVCMECKSKWINYVVLGVIAVALTGFVCFSVRSATSQWKEEGEKGGTDMLVCTFKVLINYLQMTSFLEDFSLDWPTAVKTLFSIASSSSSVPLNISFLSCSAKMSFYFRLLAFLSLPALCFAVPVLIRLVLRGIARMRGKPQPSMKESTMQTSWLVLCFLVYPTVVKQSVRVFPCSESIYGHWYLLEDFSVECGVATHHIFSVLSAIVLVGFCIGFPAACFVILLRRKQDLDKRWMKELFLFLYSGYKPEKCFWEAVILLRKFGIVVIAALLSGNTHGHQLIAGMFVLVVSLSLQLRFEPHSNPLQSLLEDVSLMASLLSLIMGQLYVSGGIGEGGKMAITAGIVVMNAVVLFFLVFIMLRESRSRLRGKTLQDKSKDGVELCVRGYSTENPVCKQGVIGQRHGV